MGNIANGTIDMEHYDAQAKYADMLYYFLNISWWHPINKIKALVKAEDFRRSHKECCEWANEEI